MYKILIVDDEASIRNGIANSIPWAAWGYEVAALCANGVEALECIRADKPDVVLSDIRMPEMDGVELMQILNAQYPEIKILILSGYSDFEYLNMSIKNQVTEYLLKPTDVDEFEQVFRNLKRKMDDERTQHKAYEESVNEHFLSWVGALLQGTARADDTQRFLPALEGKCISPENVAVVVLHVDERAGDEQRSVYTLKRRIAALCAERAGQGVLYLLTADGTLAGLYGGAGDESPDFDAIEADARALQAAVRSETGATVSVGISNLCTEADMLPQAYEQANCCASQNLFRGNESVFRFSALAAERPEDFAYFDTELIQKSLLAQDYDAMYEELTRVFATYAGGPIREYQFVDRMCLSLMFHVSLWGLQYNLYAEDILRSLGTTYTDIYKCDTLAKKKDFLLSVLFAVQLELKDRRAKSKNTNSVANRVRDFVDEEYCKNVMSLEYVAAHVHKNAAYVSRLFKNELGCNFSDYLTEKRIKKALELLENPNHRIYEIAEQCGYADASNFIKVFKKIRGISPAEYRHARGESL